MGVAKGVGGEEVKHFPSPSPLGLKLKLKLTKRKKYTEYL
jgi:hypothetical protein